ncbi:DNA repair protein RadA [bacterium]|nr:DNA repair protein RadA [bacterium]
MPKPKSIHVCQNCGFESAQWVGQCPGCGKWNTFVEEVVASGGSLSSFGSKKSKKPSPVRISSVSTKPAKRRPTGIGEFDRVLGGGFVPGQVVLLAGEPGIGKSTLLTALTQTFSEKNKLDVLYVCGEESVEQVRLRVDRLGCDGTNLLLLPETDTDAILGTITSQKDIGVVVIDSVQTLYSEIFSGLAGSISQVRGCTQLLTAVAKKEGVPVVLVGHVTKQGVVAGPKVLEHIVDTVLYLEGDSQHMFRILRTNKNRFGAVSEVGVFEMTDSGMKDVKNPSKLFLDQRLATSSGSCVTVVMEGFRPILFEVQALTVRTAFGYPRRTASGFSANRLQVLIAILEKRCGLNLSNHDVYLNVAGGFKIGEYAADLAVCMAIASSLNDKPLKEKTVVFGECGLNGEVRKVSHLDKRVSEAKKLGFTNVVGPSTVKSVPQALKKAF